MVQHFPKKSLGQNFLIDGNIAAKIVKSLHLTERDTVVEIGPGRGALTRLIAKEGVTLIAVEKDDELARSLAAEFATANRVKIIHGDIMDFDFSSFGGRLRVAGNIPYNLTSRIVSKIVDDRKNIELALLMVQEEVARRLAANHGTKDYGAISIRLQLVADVSKLFKVSPGCFFPRPTVDSRIVLMNFNAKRDLRDEDKFVVFVKRAFGMRRKMVRHFVSHFYGKEKLGTIGEKWQTGRIETFTPGEIYRLFTLLEKNA